MDNADAMDTPEPPLTPPPPAHDGEPQVTVEDPSADGYYCAARRRPGQLAAAVEDGDPNPWPYCRNRAGKGTDHPGVGNCRNHTGSTPGGRKSAKLKLAELVPGAIATLGRQIATDGVPEHVRLRAAQDILDRAGFPRRVEVDPEAARTELYERLMEIREAALEDDDEGLDDA